MHQILGPLCARQLEYTGEYVTAPPEGASYLEMDTENSASVRVQRDGWYDKMTMGEGAPCTRVQLS